MIGKLRVRDISCFKTNVLKNRCPGIYRTTVALSWKGFSPFAFALRVEAVPALGDEKKLSANEQLQRIAKANTRKADELCAADWITFSGQIYNKKEDHEFFLELMDDPRLRIRGEALAILCEHHPKTPGLYDKAMKFVEDPALTAEYVILRIRVIDQLLNTLEHLKPKVKNEAFKNLLLKNDKRLNQATLTAIRDKQYLDLLPDVIDFMMRSKDRHLQYGCIKTLYALRKRSYPAMHIFMKDPESYIDEFKLASLNKH